jgi:hypothetical protein
MFRAVETLDAEQRGTIQILDIALAKILEGGSANQAVELVSAILIRNERKIPKGEFSSFGGRLLQHPILPDVVVQWLLRGDRSLCEWLCRLFQRNVDQPLDLVLPLNSRSAAEKYFISRKILGFFFFQSVLAASLIVCVLRSCDEKEGDAIADLLFEVLLRNYGGKVVDYLNGVEEHDLAYKYVRRALHKHEKYFAEVRSVGDLKELYPPEHNVAIARLRTAEEFRNAHKEAEKKSVLLSLVSRSTVLYGKRTLSYPAMSGNERKPFKMDLQAHGFSLEIPRTEVIDPYGLDYLLRVLRVEQLEK